MQDLLVGWGGHITSNSSMGGGSKNIVVEDSLIAGANSAIQWGVIDVSGARPETFDITEGCEPISYGLGSDLCGW